MLMNEARPDNGGTASETRPVRESFGSGMRRRLFSNRFPLGVAVALFSGLAAAGVLSFWPAFACVAAMTAVSAFAPVRSARERRIDFRARASDSRDLARSRAVMDSLPDPLIALDGRGMVRAVNKACRRFFGDTI